MVNFPGKALMYQGRACLMGGGASYRHLDNLFKGDYMLRVGDQLVAKRQIELETKGPAEDERGHWPFKIRQLLKAGDQFFIEKVDSAKVSSAISQQPNRTYIKTKKVSEDLIRVYRYK
jgi:hypothetical protein